MNKLIITLLFTLSFNLAEAAKYYPGQIFLKSGSLIDGEIAIPTHARKNNINYVSLETDDVLKISSEEIDYLIVEVGGRNYKFKYATIKTFGANKTKIKKRAYWMLMDNTCGGDKIELYTAAHNYGYRKRQNEIVAFSDLNKGNLFYLCVSKPNDQFAVYAGKAAGVPSIFGGQPPNNTSTHTRVIENYLNDKPELLKRYDEYEMNIFDICDYYQSLFD